MWDKEGTGPGWAGHRYFIQTKYRRWQVKPSRDEIGNNLKSERKLIQILSLFLKERKGKHVLNISKEQQHHWKCALPSSLLLHSLLQLWVPQAAYFATDCVWGELISATLQPHDKIIILYVSRSQSFCSVSLGLCLCSWRGRRVTLWAGSWCCTWTWGTPWQGDTPPLIILQMLILYFRYFVYSVAVSSLIMVWQIGTTYNFRFSSTRDVGITVYLLIVSTFFFTQTPLGCFSGDMCLNVWIVFLQKS